VNVSVPLLDGAVHVYIVSGEIGPEHVESGLAAIARLIAAAAAARRSLGDVTASRGLAAADPGFTPGLVTGLGAAGLLAVWRAGVAAAVAANAAPGAASPASRANSSARMPGT